ncbi:MAG: 3-oxoadipate enol-lactonase, partial [Pseudomonadota bacterium]
MTGIQSARINGIDLVYAVSGAPTAPSVVLHHPLATRLDYWDPVMAGLEKAFRVIRFDARGHGRSTAALPPYTFDMLAADVIGLMDHLGVKRAQFIGLSMGGMVGQKLGLAHAARFSSLTLVSTTSRIAPEFKSLWRDRVTIAREKGMTSQVEPAMARWVAEATRKSRPDLVKTFSAMIEATPLDGYAGWCGAIHDLDFTDQLGAIKQPVRVIVGELDPATPVAAS